MRVLLVNDHPPGPTGGAEVHVGRLQEALGAVGDEVEVLYPDRPHRGPGRVLDLWDPRARRRARDLVERFRPDVVHFHNILDELSTSVLDVAVPAVLTVHDPRLVGIRFGVDQDQSRAHPRALLRDGKNRVARERLRRRVGATIAPSRELADAVAAAGFPRVHHIPNFAELAPLEPPGVDVVYVGHLRTHKGAHLALEAFVACAGRHPESRLRLVGDGPLQPDLEDRAEAAGLSDRVVLEGRLEPEAVRGVLRDAAVVVVPSLGVEGGGPTLVVIEAMAAGRPVVVHDRPGLREGVDDTVGAVVAAEDPATLGRAVDALLGDREGLERRGAAARARAAERWSPGATVPCVRRVYEEVLAGG